MTKEAAPVCGAPTRAGTSCQNTLVTGCGRCPVHASQLRAAQSGTKQSSRPRRKKPSRKPPPHHPNATTTMQAAMHAASASLNEPELHTPVASHRGIMLASPESRPDATIPFSDALTPLQSYTPSQDLHTPMQPTTQYSMTVKNEVASLNNALKNEKESHCSPITPTTPDNNQRFDIYPAENALAEDPPPTEEDVLQGQSVAYLGVDLANMDIPIPKMNFNFM